MVPRGERRRKRIRHKLHTPVYASFSEPSQPTVLDLSELIDLHEEGFSVRTSEPLEPNRAVNVCLDLSETKTYIHASGHVVWTDGKGRAGVCLSGLADHARRSLKEWLFINLLIAAANHKARTEQLAQVVEEPAEQQTTIEQEPVEKPVTLQRAASSHVPDLSSLLFAVDAVHRELQAYKGDFDKVFSLITERALSLTGATGGALAIKSNDRMVCRASMGEPAPPLDSSVDVKQGFSGECVRTACTTTCEDSESDSRVDRQICRVLGIRSIMATPIFSDVRVVGLLEVFSPRPGAFAKIHEIVLEKLAELVPIPPLAPPEPPSASRPAGYGTDPEPVQNDSSPAFYDSSPALFETQQRRSVLAIRRLPFWSLAAAVAVGSLLLGYVLAPTIERRWFSKPEAAVQAASVDSSVAANSKTRGPIPLPELRKLAEQGDADAQWNLGVRYHHGDGVPQDDAVAVKWFQRAAEQGYVLAQGALGADYWAGRGVHKDLSKSYFWSTLAMAQGDETSKSRLEGLASQMTRTEMLAARQQADDWIRQHAQKVKPN